MTRAVCQFSLALLTLTLVVGAGRVGAEENFWNQFRGPNGSGVAATSRPPVQLGPDCLAWKTAVPPGLSSPVLWQKQIFLTAVEGDRLVTLAFDAASGKEIWRQAAPAVPMEKVHPTSSPAASTILADAERLYVYFGSYGLLCYDHAGRMRWQKPIPTPKNVYGMATSPIADGDKLILVLDNDANLADSKLSQSRILALKKATGETVWETARPLVRSGWSTPMIWRHDTGRELVVFGSGRVGGYDLESGVEQWFVTGFSRETIAVPVAGKGLVYASAAMLGGVSDAQPDPQPFWDAMLHFDTNGDGRLDRSEINEHFTFPLRPELPVDHPGFGVPLADDPAKRKEQQAGIFASMDKDKDGYVTREELFAALSFRRGKPMLVAIRPGGQGDVTASHVAWQLHQSVPEIPSPLYYQDRLYLVRNGGNLAAVDATSGKLIYNERLGSAGQYSASPVVAAGHLYLLSNRGVVSVVKTGDTFQLARQYDLGEAAMVTPAFDARTIYVRTATRLWAFRAR